MKQILEHLTILPKHRNQCPAQHYTGKKLKTLKLRERNEQAKLVVCIMFIFFCSETETLFSENLRTTKIYKWDKNYNEILKLEKKEIEIN